MAKRQKLDYNHQELTQHLKESVGQGVNAFFSPSPPPQSAAMVTKEEPGQEKGRGEQGLRVVPQAPAEVSVSDPMTQLPPQTITPEKQGESREDHFVSEPTEQPIDQSVNQSTDPSTRRSRGQLTGQPVDRPVSFYLPKIIDKKIDDAVLYYQ